MFGPSWPGSPSQLAQQFRFLTPLPLPAPSPILRATRSSGYVLPKSPGSLADNASKTANAMLVETTGTLFPAGRALVGGLSKTTNCDDNIE